MSNKENKWQEIWSGKQVVTQDDRKNEFDRFCELKKANGFDVAVEDGESYYRYFYNEWLEFFDKITELAGGDIKSVFEIGCGSGVNLYMFLNRKNECQVGGVDYSASMIESAKIATGSDNFYCCGADDITVEPKYDIVMSESVFQYFDSLEYAESVLRKMIEKSRKLTYLGEIHNAEFEKELMDKRRKTFENYEEKYKGLSKRFYEKGWIEKIAGEYGKKVYFTDVNNADYINGKYIFNCYIV